MLRRVSELKGKPEVGSEMSVRTGVLVVAATVVTACYDPQSPCACTEEFRTYTVSVVDRTGALVPGITITRLHVRTGVVLVPGWLGMLEPGVYVVADDAMLDAFSSRGDTVRVSGMKDGTVFSVDFVCAVPEPCRCHVELRSGPDTVIIR